MKFEIYSINGDRVVEIECTSSEITDDGNGPMLSFVLKNTETGKTLQLDEHVSNDKLERTDSHMETCQSEYIENFFDCSGREVPWEFIMEMADAELAKLQNRA